MGSNDVCLSMKRANFYGHNRADGVTTLINSINKFVSQSASAAAGGADCHGIDPDFECTTLTIQFSGGMWQLILHFSLCTLCATLCQFNGRTARRSHIYTFSIRNLRNGVVAARFVSDDDVRICWMEVSLCGRRNYDELSSSSLSRVTSNRPHLKWLLNSILVYPKRRYPFFSLLTICCSSNGET